jgi:hypothetical protein
MANPSQEQLLSLHGALQKLLNCSRIDLDDPLCRSLRSGKEGQQEKTFGAWLRELEQIAGGCFSPSGIEWYRVNGYDAGLSPMASWNLPDGGE